MTIVLLVQEKSNLSVRLLAEALKKEQGSQVLVFEIKDTELYKGELNSFIFDGESRINVENISLVIKRTWGPIRQEGLGICQALEKQGLTVLNGCDFIGWSRSKIQQYATFKNQNKQDVFPKTVIIPSDLIENLIKKSEEEKKSFPQVLFDPVDALHGLPNFPMVLKKDRGILSISQGEGCIIPMMVTHDRLNMKIF